ncbi:hypothetical protein G4B88_008747, partial [Cannabis sativa]
FSNKLVSSSAYCLCNRETLPFHLPNRNLNDSKRFVFWGQRFVGGFEGFDFNHGAKKIFDADDRGEVIDGDLGKHFDVGLVGEDARQETIMQYSHENPNRTVTKNKRLDDCLRYCIVAGKKVLEDVDLGGEKLSKVVEKPGDNSLAKLKHLYTHAKDLSQSEESVSNMLMNQLDALLPSGTQGQQRRRN